MISSGHSSAPVWMCPQIAGFPRNRACPLCTCEFHKRAPRDSGLSWAARDCTGSPAPGLLTLYPRLWARLDSIGFGFLPPRKGNITCHQLWPVSLPRWQKGSLPTREEGGSAILVRSAGPARSKERALPVSGNLNLWRRALVLNPRLLPPWAAFQK